MTYTEGLAQAEDGVAAYYSYTNTTSCYSNGTFVDTVEFKSTEYNPALGTSSLDSPRAYYNKASKDGAGCPFELAFEGDYLLPNKKQ